jgi:hypothetical protein
MVTDENDRHPRRQDIMLWMRLKTFVTRHGPSKCIRARLKTPRQNDRRAKSDCGRNDGAENCLLRWLRRKLADHPQIHRPTRSIIAELRRYPISASVSINPRSGRSLRRYQRRNLRPT